MFVKNEVTVNNAVILDFIEPGTLVDGELELMLIECYAGNAQLRLAPAYRFKMANTHDGRAMGRIELRLGNSENLRMYAGHIGYRVHEAFRGRHYAARAVQLLVPLARYHQLGTLWITCNPENLASRRSCELAGLTFTEIVKVPPSSDMYAMGDRQKCRYQMVL
ncbi:MAG: GNAT family N-acetyltransferase [Caldilineaceae bacterium]